MICHKDLLLINEPVALLSISLSIFATETQALFYNRTLLRDTQLDPEIDTVIFYDIINKGEGNQITTSHEGERTPLSVKPFFILYPPSLPYQSQTVPDSFFSAVLSTSTLPLIDLLNGMLVESNRNFIQLNV